MAAPTTTRQRKSMTTIHGPADVASLLVLSDERDVWLRRLLAAYHEGYARGREDGYQAGYVTGVLARKHADRDVYEGLQLEARRWELRGEQRTRATFGRPHPDDHQGREGAA
jgi:hypothetical protein